MPDVTLRCEQFTAWGYKALRTDFVKAPKLTIGMPFDGIADRLAFPAY